MYWRVELGGEGGEGTKGSVYSSPHSVVSKTGALCCCALPLQKDFSLSVSGPLSLVVED